MGFERGGGAFGKLVDGFRGGLEGSFMVVWCAMGWERLDGVHVEA